MVGCARDDAVGSAAMPHAHTVLRDQVDRASLVFAVRKDTVSEPTQRDGMERSAASHLAVRRYAHDAMR